MSEAMIAGRRGDGAPGRTLPPLDPWYVTAFTDGEGCFALHWGKWGNCAQDLCLVWFVIRLRADDKEILERIQAHWGGIGNLHYVGPHLCRGGANPQWIYKVCKSRDLATVVVPHFDKCPLQAKKARDHAIWRRAILLHHEITNRPARSLGRGGRLPSYTPAEREQLRQLASSLQEQRRYRSPPIHVPPAPPAPQRTLFDLPGVGWLGGQGDE